MIKKFHKKQSLIRTLSNGGSIKPSPTPINSRASFTPTNKNQSQTTDNNKKKHSKTIASRSANHNSKTIILANKFEFKSTVCAAAQDTA